VYVRYIVDASEQFTDVQWFALWKLSEDHLNEADCSTIKPHFTDIDFADSDQRCLLNKISE